MKVYLETFGCQMNKLDSELALAQLTAAGHELSADPKAADVVLYNTCSVRQHAENKVHSRIGQQSQRKASGKRVVLGVMGCMAQRAGQALLDRYPQLDLVIGPSQADQLAELVAAVVKDGYRGLAVAPARAGRSRDFDQAANRRLDAFDLARPPDAGHSRQAFVRVQRGCDKFCTYCVVPYVRGSEQSRDPDSIVAEVRRLADGGVQEVTLLGQTVNSYRHAGPDGREVRLADLLERIEPVAGIERVRFVTSYPAEFDRTLLEAMRDLPKVCEYLHIPAQSGSDRMLTAMNRRYSVAEYLELVAMAREIVPDLALAGDFIVGFPGESEADFQASAELIRQVGYKNSFIFKYSPRPDTVAERRLADDVPPAVKSRRNNELLAVQNEVSLAHNQALIGSTQRVLVEGLSRRSAKQPDQPRTGWRQVQGRTRGDHIVAFDAPPSLVGQLADVRIASATPLALRGQWAEPTGTR